MKKLLLITLLIPFVNNAQTKTTVANGNFYSPGTWDCFCIPANGDNLIINHSVNMDFDIYYTNGQILINSGASLTEGAADRAVWVDGSGTFINNGTFTANHFLMSPFTSLTNGGNLLNIDSLWNQGTMTNSGTASIADLLNDETASLNNSGSITITNDMNNQGYFFNNGSIDLANDFSNCNTQTMDAMFVNDGIFCIAADMTNCIDDTLAGSGDYYIGGSSSNFGAFDGTFTFHTPSGTIGFQGGTVSPGVTVTTGACNLGIETLDDASFTMYPNPAATSINVSVTDVNYDLYDYSGKLISSGKIANHQIDLTKINLGMYTLIIENYGTSRFVKN